MFAPPLFGRVKDVQAVDDASHAVSLPVVVRAKNSFPPEVALGQVAPPVHPIGPEASIAK